MSASSPFPSRVIGTTIVNGTAISPLADLEGYELMSVEIPVGFEGSYISFQGASSSGSTPRDLYTESDDEVMLAVLPDRHVTLTATARAALRAFRYIKIRAGLTAAPTVQSGDRAITFMAKRT